MRKKEIDHILKYSGGLKSHPKWLRRKIVELVRHAVAFKTMKLHKYKTYGEFYKAFKEMFGFNL